MKKVTVILIIFILLMGGAYAGLQWNSLNKINKKNMHVDKIIEYVDEVSDNKAQVNWRYVAAIVGVEKKNKFEEANQSDFTKVAKMFINDKNELKTLDAVVKELKFNDTQTSRVHKYVDGLADFGISPDRTKKDTKQMKFIDSIKSGATETYKKYKILPSITIAQAILESSWGESKLTTEANNLFGIKSNSSWTGQTITAKTTEFNGIVTNDIFRKYNDKNESITNHGEFLSKNKRYADQKLFEHNTYKEQAQALQDAGYSTLTDNSGQKIYAKRLIQLIKQYNLQCIDSEVQTKS